MKFLCVFSLFLGTLIAQPNTGSEIIDFGSGVTDELYDRGLLVLSDRYSWEITQVMTGPNEYAKAFTYSDQACGYYKSQYLAGGGYTYIKVTEPICTPIAESVAKAESPIQAALVEYYSLAPDVYHFPPAYKSDARSIRPRLAIVQPTTAPDPALIFLDGLGDSLYEFDLTTFGVLGQVVVPSTSGPLGVRPAATGDANEVWVANGGAGVSVADLSAQGVIATIPTPSIPVAVAPAGIVFTNSGDTALYAVGYYSPDASGNNGALVVFDAVNRKVTATLPLKYAPTALVMAPDGLTAYLLSNSGMITYYDVLSGTADLSASTYTPGLAGGYPGASSAVFIHPDGTRLFWNVGYMLTAFDLTTRKIAGYFNSGLPSTSGSSIQMSQDGSTIWFANGPGNVVILDTRYGNILATYQTSPESAVYPGPAY